MDRRDISKVFVLENCARTSTLATEVIDTLTVPTGSVQAHAKLVDSGAAALSYYGPGELLITDSYGIALDATTALKAIPQIGISQRSADGTSHFGYPALKGNTIKTYEFTPYAAPSQQVTILDGIELLNNHNYMIKIRRIGSETKAMKEPTVKTAYYSSDASATATEIVTGLAAYINTNFNTDPVLPVTAAVGGAASDALIITALPLEWELGKYKYQRLKFVVELVNFNGTLVNNMYGDLLHNAITYDHATAGAGNYEQVADMEFYAKLNTGANRDLLAANHRRTIVPIDAAEFEDDGTTENRYDTVVINFENVQGDWSANVQQQGAIVMFFPVDNNDTNQQNDVIATLNKYIVTEWGVGSAITLT
jgi:uncharacterized protein YutD